MAEIVLTFEKKAVENEESIRGIFKWWFKDFINVIHYLFLLYVNLEYGLESKGKEW